MGIYLNPGNQKFNYVLNFSDIYVDKTMMIEITNRCLFGENKEICVSRPRRFGKSITAEMLAAYYSRGCDSIQLFSDLKISKTDNYKKYLNKFNVIHFDMQKFLVKTNNITDMLAFLEEDILADITEEFSDVKMPSRLDISRAATAVFEYTGIPFVFIIDEWDCVLREYSADTNQQKIYLDYLYALLKNQSYVALAYMTGILPVKKYGKHSALNMFKEYSMTNQKRLAEFTGFTEDEVRTLCDTYNMPFEQMKKWYNGYNVNGFSIYNPKSVIEALTEGIFDNYWTQTETYEALKVYIEKNFFGLRDTVIKLIAGESIEIDTTTFVNDMVSFRTQDDILTLLIHLGYLTFDFDNKTVSIPNHEVRQQFISTAKVLQWNNVTESIKESQALLKYTLEQNGEKVSEILGKVHNANTSVIQYNDENSLACVLALAYYSAQDSYGIYRELAGGKEFADLVFIPRYGNTDPAIIVELKWNKTAQTAISQIHERKYAESLKDYHGDVLLVGINYDIKQKEHKCEFEMVCK